MQVTGVNPGSQGAEHPQLVPGLLLMPKEHRAALLGWLVGRPAKAK